ncbi:hypothetical protein EBU99_08065 [bacterium]|nr:hypothetical protein [bacterium]
MRSVFGCSLPLSFVLSLASINIVACMPGQYATVPLPAGGRRLAAEGTNQAPSNGAKTPASNSPANTGTNPAAPGSAAPKGTTFAPGVPDVDALRKCLNLWGTTPFTEVKREQVKEMDVAVGVGGGIIGGITGVGGLSGLGNLFNIGNTKDLEVTPQPRLVVLPLSVNLGASTTFELMNPNGWYCIKAAVGAKSTINIKLHCNAKIAQSDLGISLETKPTTPSSPSLPTGSVPTAPGAIPELPVRVGINDGSTSGSQLGILVDSSVNLTRVNSSGGACSP